MSSNQGFGRMAALISLILIHGTCGIFVAASDFIYREENGAPIPSYTTSRTCGRNGPIVLEDITLIQNIAKFGRERQPERVVHALGTGAFGKFTVTHDITRYTKAAVFFKIGQETRIAMRFSTSVHPAGVADTHRNPRGFAVKFYTTDGIWDCVGNDAPVFYLRDPMLFPSMAHALRRSPRTYIYDPNRAWDFPAKRHEMLYQLLYVYSDRGTPDGWIHMNGYGVHTFVLVNQSNEPVYCKFHFLTNQGIRNLTAEASTKIAGENPFYCAQMLFETIAAGKYPSWSMSIQVMTFQQAEEFRYNVFDPTKAWPESDYPLIPVGQLELNELPKNYFHQIEQLAFCPSHLVPGIQPSRDRMLQARMFAYKDSQRHRLGPNYMLIPVNRPLQLPYNLQRDGPMNMFNKEDEENYYPSSFSEYQPDPSVEFINYTCSGMVARHDTGDDDNYTQAREFYLSLSEYDRETIAKNIGADLRRAKQEIKDRTAEAFANIDENLGKQIAKFAAQTQ